MNKIFIWVITAITLILSPIRLYAQAPDTVWTRRYEVPGINYCYARSCAIDDSGNIYVAGYTEDWMTDRHYLIIKYNTNGDTVWTRWGIDGAAYDCIIDDFNNIYVTGASGFGCLTIKYTASGETLWTRQYNCNGGGIYNCSIDNMDNLYVTGYAYDTLTSYDFQTIKYNENGDTLWTRRYDFGGPELPTDCMVDDVGNLYVIGQTQDDYLIVKYNANGDTLWTRRFDSEFGSMDNAYGCAVDKSGNLYVSGNSTNFVYDDCLTIKYSSDGDTIWTRWYNGPDNWSDGAYSCAIDSSDNLYVTGYSSNGYTSDYLTIKYNSIGDTLWTCRYNGSADMHDEAFGCAVDGLGNLFYVTGQSGCDFLTIKYNTATGVAGKPEFPITSNNLRLEQNTPNPFSQHTTISYQLPANGQTNIKIYNTAGQLVKMFDMGLQQSGYHLVEWRDSKIPAGVYFYRLTSGNYQATKQLVVVK